MKTFRLFACVATSHLYNSFENNTYPLPLFCCMLINHVIKWDFRNIEVFSSAPPHFLVSRLIFFLFYLFFYLFSIFSPLKYYYVFLCAHINKYLGCTWRYVRSVKEFRQAVVRRAGHIAPFDQGLLFWKTVCLYSFIFYVHFFSRLVAYYLF